MSHAISHPSPHSLERKRAQAKEAHRQQIARFLQHEPDPERVAGMAVYVPKDHPSGLGGQHLYIPKHWERFMAPPESSPAPAAPLHTSCEVEPPEGVVS